MEGPHRSSTHGPCLEDGKCSPTVNGVLPQVVGNTTIVVDSPMFTEPLQRPVVPTLCPVPKKVAPGGFLKIFLTFDFFLNTGFHEANTNLELDI